MGIMRRVELQVGRKERGWTQVQAAARLGLSQPYLSMLENGQRPLSHGLARKLARLYGLPATLLPLPEQLPNPATTDAQVLAEQLAALGYPGFAYLRSRHPKKNPAELLLTALAQDNLEARLVEALPWLLLRYWDLDADWLVEQAKRRDLQNRLGFVVCLAGQVAQKQDPAKSLRLQALTRLEATLERSRLACEDTLCQADLSEPERRWLKEDRNEEAQRWNLLTDWRQETLRYVA